MRSSPEAGRLVKPQGANGFFSRHSMLLSLLCIISFSVFPFPAHAQGGSQQTPAASLSPQDESKQNSAELATHDEPTTFKLNVKLVVVRAVVRDPQGNAIGGLRQEDFRVFDRGKPQVITQFEVEQPGALAVKARRDSDENAGDIPAGATPSNAGNVSPPQHFVAYVFDDVHLEFGDLAQVRRAAERHFATLKPTDRAAIFTTSGLTSLDFTDDHAQLHETLLRLQPHPISRNLGLDCPQISYYQADLIVNQRDPQAIQVALQEAALCGGPTGGNSATMVETISAGVLSAGDHETHVSFDSLKDVVRKTSRLPGQRSVVLVSPGFISPRLQYEYTEIVDRALRSEVVVSTLDARGLYVITPFGNASQQGGTIGGAPPPPDKMLIENAAILSQADLLAAFADDTGGIFFHNSNDLDEGFRRVAETPEYSYVLAFVPQNLKLDGSFHGLKVTLTSPQKLTLQARRGYYAPKNFASPDEQAKQEIEDEMFSQEELHKLPVKLHTQFYKATDQDAKLIVLAHVDVRLLHFRKADGRNNDVLTCVSALFNRNGHFIQGTEKTVTMHLKDETLEHKFGSGITLKTSFDVKPGNYLVRLVVRDAEGQMMSAENGTVEIH